MTPNFRSRMKAKRFPLNLVPLITGIGAIIFFACSSLRHALFQSTAYDLGWYDQVVYLISSGQPPIISFWGNHIMGDHAAVILYPLALLYKIAPNVHWLFFVQSIALASGCWLTAQLARQEGLKPPQAEAMAVVYLLYPVVFNLNLFDFHPEVLLVPGLFGAVLAARAGKIGWFCATVGLTLLSKAVLSLTVAAMGFWLLIFEKRRWYGCIALTAGIAWFLIATQVVIPHFSGGEAAGVGRYSFLGDSVFEIILNLFLKPGIVLGKIFTLPNLEYLILLFIPIIWGISARHLAPLVAILPTLAMNLITDLPAQKDLVHQYSLTALPFFILAIISALAAKETWFQRKRWIILWALISFLALAKYGYFWSKYAQELDTLAATREAVARVETKGGVLTAAQIAPHLTHRPLIKLALDELKDIELSAFDYVLLNLRHPGWQSSPETMQYLTKRVQQIPAFEEVYRQDDVVLWERKGSG
ncbi:DUF2079 domain-containing protein [Lusitaniella coriacea]|uniref:DUF2079 domain-containing protein n=1 Tax=Lusitaniella coriacea TaxID=1983105 RepID=UPI003CF83BE5